MALRRSLIASALAVAVAAPAPGEGLPEPVAQALSDMEARIEPEQRWAFTRATTMVSRDGESETVVERFDPRRPPGEEWLRISPPREEDEAREARSGCRRQAARGYGPRGTAGRRPAPAREEAPQEPAPPDAERYADDGAAIERIVITAACPGRDQPEPRRADRNVLVQANDVCDLRVMMGGEVRTREDEAETVYESRPARGAEFCLDEDGRDPGGDFVLQKILVEATITAGGQTLHAVRLHAPRPFRVIGVLRVTEFDVTQHYGEVEPGGPYAVLGSDGRWAARLLFKRFGQTGAVIHSDFERVVVPDTLLP